MQLLIRLIVNAVALYAAASFVDGISLTGDIVGIAFVALIFGVINAFVKPIVKIFSFPLIAITLGLFTLIINAFLLMLTSALVSGLHVSGFGAAFVGAIIISIVSWLLSTFVGDDS